MAWITRGYGAVAYWYSRAVLRNVTAYDTVDTILINAGLTLIIGPCLLVPATVCGWIMKR